MNKSGKIFVAGHRGLVGSAILRSLQKNGFNNIITRTHSELDLTDSSEVEKFFKEEKPEYVILAAAKVGGIKANNTYRADFIYENLCIQNNVIHFSYKYNVNKLLFLGSSCIYPKNCKQPINEDYLLTDILEYTNEPYAIAKISGIKMCESYNLQYGTNFISVMPTNLYGPNDNYNLETSHVLPAMIRKMYLAKCFENNDWSAIDEDLNKRPVGEVNKSSSTQDKINMLNQYGIFKKQDDNVELKLWGTGAPRREFLHSNDMADACVHIMREVDFNDLISKDKKEVRNTHINIGTGSDISIKELAELIKKIVGFKGEITWNTEMPDGTFQKLLNVSKLNSLGWKYSVELEDGIRSVFNNYLKN